MHGVLAFPQLLMITTVSAGIIINYFIPINLIPRVIQFSFGIAIVSFGILIASFGFHEFRKYRMSIDPKLPPTRLITTGPFRFTRNPLYLALCTMEFGIGVLLNNIWIIGMVLPIIIILTFTAILNEEHYLFEKFGEEYLKYKSSVRRWL